MASIKIIFYIIILNIIILFLKQRTETMTRKGNEGMAKVVARREEKMKEKAKRKRKEKREGTV